MSLRPHIALPSCSHGRLARWPRPNLVHRSIRASNTSRCFQCLPPRASELSDTRRHFHHDGQSSALSQVPLAQEKTSNVIETETGKKYPADASTLPKSTRSIANASAAIDLEDIAEEMGIAFKIRKITAFDAELDKTKQTKHGANSAHASDRLHSSWFSAWDAMVERLQQTSHVGIDKHRKLFQQQHEFAKTFLADLSAEQLQEKWQSLSVSHKLSITPYLLIGSMVDSLGRSLFVLSNTDFVWNDFRVRIRCLQYLQATSGAELEQSPHLKQSFEEQISRCRVAETWPTTQLKSYYLNLLLQWSSSADGELIIQDVLTRYPFAQTEVYCIVLDHYLKSEDVDRALAFLPRIPEHLLQRPSGQLRKALHELLARDTVSKTKEGTNFKVLPRMLNLGMQPDQQVYNLVLQNAITQELSSVAWDLYHYLREQNIEIEARCYSRLLKDAFSRGYVQGLNEVMSDIHGSDKLRQDPYLIVYSMNIVRVISFFRLKTSSDESLTRIMGLYDRAWSRKPLQPFGIFNKIDEPVHKAVLLPPPPASLAFTLWSYILVQRSERVIDSLWQRITHFIDQADDVTIRPFRLEIVYNGFVLFYARKLGTLVQALKVVQYMLDSNLCAPSPRTWSLLVCAFLRHRQLDQAANVVRMMKARGLKLEYISEQHLPHDYSLADLRPQVEDQLDEVEMPEGLEALLNDRSSAYELEGVNVEDGVFEDLQDHSSRPPS